MEEAVAADRAALAETTRERMPQKWATTQVNLGCTLLELGKRERGTAHLEEAVAALNACLAECPRGLRWICPNPLRRGAGRDRAAVSEIGSRHRNIAASCINPTKIG